MAKKDAASKRAYSTTRKRKRRRAFRAFKLPELVKPDGAGYMPLYCAAQWIATRGGTLKIKPWREAPWREAFKDLLDRIASEDVKVVGVRDGVRDGVPEPISGIHFASCSVDYPFSFSGRRSDLLLSGELCLFSRPYIDDKHWRGGFNDALEDRRRRGVRWGRLMVLKADIARCWPFVSINANATLTQADATLSASASLQPQPALAVTPLVTGAPGRPTSMHLVELQYRDRWQRGEAETGIDAEAEALAEWLRTEHPDAPQLTPKTIANRLRHEHRRRVGDAQK